MLTCKDLSVMMHRSKTVIEVLICEIISVFPCLINLRYNLAFVVTIISMRRLSLVT